MMLSVGDFAQQYIQQPTEINTWEYVSQYQQEFPFNTNLFLYYDSLGHVSYYYKRINYPSGPYNYSTWYTYDAAGYLTLLHYYYEGADFNSIKKYYTYDASHKLIQCLEKTKGKWDDDFVLHAKELYDYQDGLRIRWEHYSLVYTDSLGLNHYHVYEYDDNGNLLSDTKYNANDLLQTKVVNEYSDTNELLAKTSYSWSENAHEWIHTARTEFDYDQGVLMEKRFTNWTNGVISSQKREYYTYDEAGLRTLVNYQDLQEGVYVDNYRGIYSYDYNGLCLGAFAQRWSDSTWNLGCFQNGTYLFVGKQYAYVNGIIGTIDGRTRAEVLDYQVTPNPALEVAEHTSEQCLVFPNPSAGVMKVNSQYDKATICIYDIEGRLMCSRALHSGINHLSMDDIPSGFYLWQIWSKGRQVTSGKWIKN